MTTELTQPAGGNHEIIRGTRHRPIELLLTVGLALSTLIAVTAVSIGIARADVPGADAHATPFALALFIGLLLSGMAGLTAIMAETRRD